MLKQANKKTLKPLGSETAIRKSSMAKPAEALKTTPSPQSVKLSPDSVAPPIQRKLVVKPASPSAAEPQAKIKSIATTATVKVSFALEAASAHQVSLCGTFNEWKPEATPMSRTGAGWEAVLDLCPGRHQYKFVIDGQWIHDPNARENARNEHGSLNSVIDVEVSSCALS